MGESPFEEGGCPSGGVHLIAHPGGAQESAGGVEDFGAEVQLDVFARVFGVGGGDALIAGEGEPVVVGVPVIRVVDVAVAVDGEVVASPVAEGIGDALESILKEQIVERQQDKLVDRMNRQIERRKDRLRLSMSDWLTKLLDSAADQSVP